MESISQRHFRKWDYLLSNFDAIHIYNIDPEAQNGGATEPHVSHVLSSRLSSRPMGWSSATLKKFVPILATGNCSLQTEKTTQPNKELEKVKHIPNKIVSGSLGLPHPDMIASLPAKNGKITPLNRFLNMICR